MTEYVATYVSVVRCARLISDEPDAEFSIEPGDSVAAVILDLSAHPHIELMLLDLIATADPDAEEGILVAASPWIEVEGEELTAYCAAHRGHPIVKFTLRPDDEHAGVVETFGFHICALCEPHPLAHMTETYWLAISAALPDQDYAFRPSVVPLSLIASIDPADVAYAELWAWRYAYSDRSMPPECDLVEQAHADHDVTDDRG